MGRSNSIEVVATGGALGADVYGIDLNDPEAMDDVAFATIMAAWHDNLVLRFPGQKLEQEGLLAFSQRFGELDKAPISARGGGERAPRHPEITTISNIVEDGKALGGLGHYESKWHTDMSYNDNPPKASALFAVEIPPAGGETGFANMYLAYDSLPRAVQALIAPLHCKHDSSRNSVGEVRRGFQDVYDRKEDIPGAVHPVVRVHPETGRKALFLGRRLNAFIIEMPDQDGDKLLDLLWTHATRPDFAWYQAWRLGDLVLWDNRCTLHRRDAFDPAARRFMLRTQVRDADPVMSAAA